MAKDRKPSRIKSAVLRWLGVPAHLTDEDFWREVLGTTSDAGQNVTPDRMLTISAVWACARLISETIATLPLGMYERTASGKRLASSHPLHVILHDMPNADSTASVHWESTVAAMLLRGNARAEKLYVGQRLVGLNFLHPDRLSVTRDARGQRVYRYTEPEGRQREIALDRVWNVPGFSLDGRNGVSVVAYGANVFGSALAADQAANKMFDGGLMNKPYFKYPSVLKPNQREEAREMIETRLAGAINANKPAILEAGMEVGTLGVDPSDAQLLESRGFSVEEVCRWFRVDPSMVGHGSKDSNWGTGLEQKMIWFLTFTVGPWLRRIEQAISKDLLSPVDRMRYYPKFSVEGLLRADSAGRATFYSAMVNNGILTRDEVRELEDREPLGGNAAVLTVQTAMAPIDQLGAGSTAR